MSPDLATEKQTASEAKTVDSAELSPEKNEKIRKASNFKELIDVLEGNDKRYMVSEYEKIVGEFEFFDRDDNIGLTLVSLRDLANKNMMFYDFKDRVIEKKYHELDTGYRKELGEVLDRFESDEVTKEGVLLVAKKWGFIKNN